jgi:hypothetical protein
MATWRVLTAGALALATAMAPAQAGPVTASITALATQASDGNGVVDVRYRRWHRHGHHGRHIGLGIGLGILGGIIASEAYRSRGYYYGDGGDPRVACAETFRSFEWDTGMYTTYDGDRRLCPYLY